MVHMLKSYCLPSCYASEAVLLSPGNLQTLDNWINTAVFKILGVSSNDCIQTIRCRFNFSSVRSLVEKRRSKFIDALINDSQRTRLFLVDLLPRFYLAVCSLFLSLSLLHSMRNKV